MLDLDETLVHFQTENAKARFLVRPHAYTVLKNLSEQFEVVVWTAAQRDYADFILDKLDTKRVITQRLYREHCCMTPTSHVKVGL